VASILEIAQHAGVSPEQVLRVVNREPVAEQTASRVNEAIGALGPPPYPPSVDPQVVDAALERASTDLVKRFSEATAELESTLPGEVGSVVYEALRVEVRPVAEQVAVIVPLFRRLLDELQHLASEVESERRDRVDDLALQVELVRSSWQSVDRRLGRLERMMERLQPPPVERSLSNVVRVEDRSRPGA
jgi:hypothetical protein